MSAASGTEVDDVFFMSTMGAPIYPETGHSYNA